jgi:hypothetical protein
VSIAVEYDRTRRWVIATASGPLTLSEILHFINTARAGEEFRWWPLVFDATAASADNVTSAQVEQCVQAVQRAVDADGMRGHVALIASDNQLYSRMLEYEVGCARINVRVIRVFRQRPDAEHWLQVMSETRHFRSA